MNLKNTLYGLIASTFLATMPSMAQPIDIKVAGLIAIAAPTGLYNVYQSIMNHYKPVEQTELLNHEQTEPIHHEQIERDNHEQDVLLDHEQDDLLNYQPIELDHDQTEYIVGDDPPAGETFTHVRTFSYRPSPHNKITITVKAYIKNNVLREHSFNELVTEILAEMPQEFLDSVD